MALDALIWIPARGGSRRIPGKNLHRVGGASMLGRAVWAARELVRSAGIQAAIHVDTDDAEIAEEARSWGAQVPFLREPAVAADTTSSADSALRYVERLREGGNEVPGLFVLMQPTSPLRDSAHLLACWERLRDEASGVISVRPADLEAGASMLLGPGGRLARRAGQAGSVVCPTGAFYGIGTERLERGRSFHVDGETVGVVVRGHTALDVDEPWQLDLADAYLLRPRRRRAPSFVIAEAGVNHNGDVGRALEMVDVAAEVGADAVKFQTFEPSQLTSASAPKAEYQAQNMGSGGSQLEMLEALTLPLGAYERLVERSRERGIRFMSTPFDAGSARFLVELGVTPLKIPSGEVTHWPFLEACAGLGVPLILSTGMSTLPEVAGAVHVLRSAGCEDLTLLHCVSDYPADPAEANLRAMATMEATFDVPVGWSDHTLGTEVALAAVALGACVVEKHFTLDRTLPGPDHAASLQPDELARMIAGIRTVEEALGTGLKVPTAAELRVADVARRSLHAARDLPRGHRLAEADLSCLRPGTGIPPTRLAQVVGRTLAAPLARGQIVEDGHLG